MEFEAAHKRAEELRQIINRNSKLYYDEDNPELSDYDYDQIGRAHV